uniref:Uncharacterized protein n=1 Tax=Rhizophora mucronata TaxID=61149 RepID=A0A2P2PEA3_RHIMU
MLIISSRDVLHVNLARKIHKTQVCTLFYLNLNSMASFKYGFCIGTFKDNKGV